MAERLGGGGGAGGSGVAECARALGAEREAGGGCALARGDGDWGGRLVCPDRSCAGAGGEWGEEAR